MSRIIVEMWLVGSVVVGIPVLVLAHLTRTVRGGPVPDNGIPATPQEIVFPSPSLNS